MARAKAPVPAVVEENPMAVPDFMKEFAGQGAGNLDSEDFVVPRIELMQGVSEQVQQGLYAQGEFVHSLSDFGLGREFRFVPLVVRKRYILWRPRHDGGGILARADDAVHWSPDKGVFTVKPIKGNDAYVVQWKLAPTVRESGLNIWGTYDPGNPESPPAATLIYDIVLALPEHMELGISVLSLSRTKVSPAKEFNSKLRIMVGQAPQYGCVFRCLSVAARNNNGEMFQNVDFKPAGYLRTVEELNAMRRLFEQVQTTTIIVEDRQDEDPAGGAGVEPTSKANPEAF